jgi:PTH2 family peptidyl-tRNA hydrolase
MSTKQVIVVRRDLNMPVGKIAAQVAHAAMGAIKSQMLVSASDEKREYTLVVENGTALEDWWEGIFTKPVLGCKDLAELEAIESKAIEAGLPVCRIVDSGKTVFNGQPTVTCLAIGPCFIGQFEGITSHLRLY